MTQPQPLPLVRLSDDSKVRRLQILSQELATSNILYNKWDRYYSGDQPLAFLAPEVAAQIGDRLAPMVIGWPETITDSVNRRVKPLGFLLGSGATADEELSRIFAANGMFDDAPLGQLDALVHGLAFISVWGNDEDPQTPSMTFESSHQVAASYVPGTGDRVLRDVLKQWQDEDVTRAYLYTADWVFPYRSTATAWGASSHAYEPAGAPIPNPLGAVPFVPMVNRGRLLNRSGRSELASIAPLADGINKIATDMMVTSEYYAAPRRWMTGVEIPSDPAERERFRAEMIAYQEQAAKSKVWMGGANVQYGQFPEANLDGFVRAINLLTSALASIGGLPPDDLGLNQVNPASAEARRAAETVLILRAEEKQSAFGRAYVRAMRLALAARDGVPLRALPSEYSQMAVDWKDPATPAIAQAMDAAVKGHAEGLLDTEAGQKMIGLGPAERAAMRARSDEAATAARTADVRDRMAMARELEAQGLTLNAAMAAVGLLQAAAINSAESAPAAPPAA